MREIKFRLWNLKEKRWETINYWLNLIDGRISSPESGWDLNGPIEQPKDLGMVLMQYTGLKDKNGKEIYEGDILEIKDQPQAGDFNNATYVFEYRLACFVGKMIKVGRIMREETIGWMFNGSGEVIGNIYENPELLALSPERKQTEVKE